jgi:hypothetical protein
MQLRDDNPIPIRRSASARFKAALRSIAPGAPPVPMLPVPHIYQEQNNWCWAACCEMLLALLRQPHVSQCAMASSQFGPNCCATPTTTSCDSGCWPEDAYDKFGVAIHPPIGPIDRDTLDRELSAGRAVEVYYVWADKRSSHVALITGKYPNGEYEVHDPWFGPGGRDFQDVVSAYSRGDWEMTYVGIGT